MKKMIFCLFLTLCLFTLSFSQEGYIFPLKESRELSSIFADHRNFHFHSGIDFKTGEKTGLEVYAAKSGWVYRLFASWWGYGKAVYLKHPDGKLTLYAHLSDFSEKLKKIVTDEQLKNKRYRVDIFLQDTIWIEQRELIGYSGETGTGEPHFHFEIRDEKNRPLNPLTSGFSIPDTIPPVFTSIGIRPLNLNSYVDDSTNIMIYPLRFDSKQQVYSSTEIPIVERNIGIEISAYDQMAEKGSRFGVYKLELFLDSLLVFSTHYDTVDFESSWKVELDRDFGLLKKKEGEFYKLYLDYGNDLPMYHSINRGFLEFPDSGLHQLVILAFDAPGNISRSKLVLKAIRPRVYEVLKTENPRLFMTINQDKIITQSEDGLASVEIDSGSVFRKIALQVKKLGLPRNARLRSSFYSFLPSDVPLARNAKITIRCTKGKCRLAKTGLYEFFDSAYKFTGHEIDTANNSISGEVRDLSTYVLLEDRKTPEIRELYPKPGQKISVKKIIISARVSDDLSGIGNDQDIEVYLDGDWQIPEYDPEKLILICKPVKVLSLGWHKLVIKAQDRMRNTKIIKSRFKII
ncbi:MAG: M23 family metallopeptidase [candidate division Zixibacteria bacterium]|nr:M23 family metallopeptidase [candidate division Zixibacteria bacterium]